MWIFLHLSSTDGFDENRIFVTNGRRLLRGNDILRVDFRLPDHHRLKEYRWFDGDM